MTREKEFRRVKLVDYFRKGFANTDVLNEEKRDFAEVNKKAARYGWLIHPDCCNAVTMEWLDTLTLNYNATFYKTWDDVLSKNRFELYLDQIRHYSTTYGAMERGEKIEGNGWVPNDDPVVLGFKEMKVLEPMKFDDFYSKSLDVLKSGIALKDETRKVLCEFIYETGLTKDGIKGYTNDDVGDFLSTIKNKEAQAWFALKLQALPSDAFGMLRCIVMQYTESSMLIKSKATIATIKNKAKALDEKKPLLCTLTQKQEATLSSVFNRFKPLFLAMKTPKTAKVINRIRRLAVKHHKPFKIGFWENIVNEEHPLEEVRKHLETLDNFRKVRLMMLCKERMNRTKVEEGSMASVYVIRNGKVWYREGYSPKYNQNWLGKLYFAIEDSLVKSLSKKACKVKFPSYCEIALPTSEKNYIGNYPYGTSIPLSLKDNVIGIYWRGEWGTQDFDLSFCSLDGHKFGWNASYRNDGGDVVYSGDMTRAEPEASEMFFIKATAPDGLVKVNRFNGTEGSKFRIFIAQEGISEGFKTSKQFGIRRDPWYARTNVKPYMVKPDNVLFDTMLVSESNSEQTIGCIFDNRLVLMDLKSGNKRVSFNGRFGQVAIESMKRKARAFIPMKEILMRAGFEDVEGDEKPVIDFDNLEKDTLIKLLTPDKE